MNIKMLLLATMIAVSPAVAAQPSRAPTVLTCSNGSVGDTLTISIRGTTGTVTRAGQRMTATVETDDMTYSLEIPGEGGVRVNRESGYGVFIYNQPPRLVRYECYPGVRRL